MGLFDSLKNITKSDENKLKPKSDEHTHGNKKEKGNKLMSSIAGFNETKIKEEMKNPTKGGLLSSAKMSIEATNALDLYKEKESAVKVTASSSFSDIIATLYSEGDTITAIEKLKVYLNQNEGKVDESFWYMLMDMYQIQNDRNQFDRVAFAFAQSFHKSPPSWQEYTKTEKRNLMAGKNILILEPTFKLEQTLRFKDFLKAAKQERFCRINVSQCKFEQSEMPALHALYKLFTQLKKFQVMSVLMGDNNLINFCKSYINPNSNKSLKSEFLEHEDFFWLFYLEILQWKGKYAEFEELAIEYAQKFESSAPGWEKDGVMIYDKKIEEKLELTRPELDSILTSNNIAELCEMIRSDFEIYNRSEIDFSQVQRIDFATAGAISHFIQELWMEEEHEKKEVVFKHPNELISALFEMIGVTQFVKIIPKKR